MLIASTDTERSDHMGKKGVPQDVVSDQTCEHCGNTFSAHKKARYCSSRCNNQSNYAQLRLNGQRFFGLPEKPVNHRDFRWSAFGKCEICDSDLPQGFSSFCSPECRKVVTNSPSFSKVYYMKKNKEGREFLARFEYPLVRPEGECQYCGQPARPGSKYCKGSHGVLFSRDRIKEAQQFDPISCLQCNTVFVPEHRTDLWCSRDCAKKYPMHKWKHHRPKFRPGRICDSCGTPIQPKKKFYCDLICQGFFDLNKMVMTVAFLQGVFDESPYAEPIFDRSKLGTLEHIETLYSRNEQTKDSESPSNN